MMQSNMIPPIAQKVAQNLQMKISLWNPNIKNQSLLNPVIVRCEAVAHAISNINLTNIRWYWRDDMFQVDSKNLPKKGWRLIYIKNVFYKLKRDYKCIIHVFSHFLYFGKQSLGGDESALSSLTFLPRVMIREFIITAILIPWCATSFPTIFIFIEFFVV